MMYSNGADWNMRLPSIDLEFGFWKFHRIYFANTFRLFLHDHFEVHCPWSWDIAKKHRIHDTRCYVGESGRRHEKLGSITQADCNDPEKQEAIARHAYISRSRFWVRTAGQFFFAPVSVAVVITVVLILTVVEIFSLPFA